MSLLVVDDVSYSYSTRPGSPEVVRDWSDAFERGQVTALSGESGSGKSTRLFLAALLLRPRRGAVLLDGERVDHLSDGARARVRAHDFGFIFQDAALDATRTILDNVTEQALYRGESPARHRQRARDLLDRMGVDVPVDRRPGQLSGGQAQRIAVARALLGAPKVVFADEPTGNLDRESGGVVMGMLREAAESGAAVLVVTHDERVAAEADRHVHITRVAS